MSIIRKNGRHLGSFSGRLLHVFSERCACPEYYELTYTGCADFLIERMVAEEPPFDHGEWFTALIQRELPPGGLDENNAVTRTHFRIHLLDELTRNFRIRDHRVT